MDSNTISNSAMNGLDAFFAFLPQLVGAIMIFFVGWLIAYVLKNVVAKALHMVRFDSALLESSAGNFIERIVGGPSRFVGKVVFWLVLLAALSMALAALEIEVLNDFLAAVYGYLPHVIAAVLIFLVAGLVSTMIVAFVRRVMGETPLAKGVSAVLPTVVMSIAVFMILNELQIAKDIVNVTYTALIGSIALAAALAFGLGGRDVAARMLETAYEAGRRNVGTVRREAKAAAESARNEAAQLKRKARK